VDSALCESVIEPIKPDEHPLNHGGWHGPNELPKDVNEGLSDDVLVDMNGNRKHFQVAWYDFDEKQWQFHVEDTSLFEPENIRWSYLPMA